MILHLRTARVTGHRNTEKCLNMEPTIYNLDHH